MTLMSLTSPTVEKPRLSGPYHSPPRPANDVNDDTNRHNPGTIVFFRKKKIRLCIYVHTTHENHKNLSFTYARMVEKARDLEGNKFTWIVPLKELLPAVIDNLVRSA